MGLSGTRQVFIAGVDNRNGALAWHKSLPVRGGISVTDLSRVDDVLVFSGTLRGDLEAGGWRLQAGDQPLGVLIGLSMADRRVVWASYDRDQSAPLSLKLAPGGDGKSLFVASTLVPPVMGDPAPNAFLVRYECSSQSLRKVWSRALESSRVHDIALSRDGGVVIVGMLHVRGQAASTAKLFPPRRPASERLPPDEGR
jgi:hypothetical protein